MLIVQKYGGTSIGTLEKIKKVSNNLIRSKQEGNKLVVVMSAMCNMTDELLKTAYSIDKNPSKRELDMLLSSGEQQAVALMAITLKSLGHDAISLNAYQIKIHSSSNYNNAKIKYIDTKRIHDELENNKIVIITGFQGIDENNNITTLGRGGSDTTAVAIAAAINADICEIYTDVNGIYSADPRVVKNAIKIDKINYDEMIELASLGAKVLHNRSVELAKKNNIKLIVRSSFHDKAGTIVRG